MYMCNTLRTNDDSDLNATDEDEDGVNVLEYIKSVWKRPDGRYAIKDVTIRSAFGDAMQGFLSQAFCGIYSIVMQLTRFANISSVLL